MTAIFSRLLGLAHLVCLNLDIRIAVEAIERLVPCL
jgi:hypothetical protein